jgi:hypothetical protein
MTTESRIPGVNESVNWIFQQPNWVRAYVIGGILSLIPIVSFMPMGYALLIMRDVLRGEPPRLPDWDGLWGETFVLGFKAFLLLLLYGIPAAVLLVFLMVLHAGPLGAGIGVLVLLLVGLLAPLALGRMLIHDSFGAGLALTEILGDLQKAGRAYFLAWALTILVTFVFGAIGGIPVVGFLIAIAATFGLTLWMCVLWGTVCRPILNPPPGPVASGPITPA